MNAKAFRKGHHSGPARKLGFTKGRNSIERPLLEQWAEAFLLQGCRRQAAVHALGGMLSNPDFNPPREDGETTAQAFARRAVDYAEALAAELQRREGGQP